MNSGLEIKCQETAGKPEQQEVFANSCTKRRVAQGNWVDGPALAGRTAVSFLKRCGLAQNHCKALLSRPRCQALAVPKVVLQLSDKAAPGWSVAGSLAKLLWASHGSYHKT